MEIANGTFLVQCFEHFESLATKQTSLALGQQADHHAAAQWSTRCLRLHALCTHGNPTHVNSPSLQKPTCKPLIDHTGWRWKCGRARSCSQEKHSSTHFDDSPKSFQGLPPSSALVRLQGQSQQNSSAFGAGSKRSFKHVCLCFVLDVDLDL